MIVCASELGAPLPARMPFESVPAREVYATMGWAGTLGEVVMSVAATIEGRTSLDESFWQPTRLVRGIIDAPLSLPGRPQLIHDATLVAMQVYAGAPVGSGLDRLSRRLDDLNLLEEKVEQKADGYSFDGTDAESSRTSARTLTRLVRGPALMVAVCHGGLASGLETLLYRAANGHSDDTIYPVRFSKDKHNDQIPRLSGDERKMLGDAADGRTVVVWDEDANTGETVAEVIVYLRRQANIEVPMIGMVNMDLRDDPDVSRQGRYWKRSAKRAI